MSSIEIFKKRFFVGNNTPSKTFWLHYDLYIYIHIVQAANQKNIYNIEKKEFWTEFLFLFFSYVDTFADIYPFLNIIYIFLPHDLHYDLRPTMQRLVL